jgi:hypothetical protein
MALTGRLHPLLVHFPRRLWMYRIALFSAAACVAVAGHFGAALVSGADFVRP